MKLKFDSNLEYQLEARQSVTNLFEGLPREQSGLKIDFGKSDDFMSSELGIGNNLIPSSDQLKANALQTFKSHNMGKEKHNQIVFRT